MLGLTHLFLGMIKHLPVWAPVLIRQPIKQWAVHNKVTSYSHEQAACSHQKPALSRWRIISGLLLEEFCSVHFCLFVLIWRKLAAKCEDQLRDYFDLPSWELYYIPDLLKPYLFPLCPFLSVLERLEANQFWSSLYQFGRIPHQLWASFWFPSKLSYI